MLEAMEKHEQEEEHVLKYNVNQDCPKCGGYADATWHRMGIDCGIHSLHDYCAGEHIHRVCATCRYDWCELPLDAAKNQTEEATK